MIHREPPRGGTPDPSEVLLRDIECTADLTPQQRHRLRSLGTTLVVRAGRTLCRPGSSGRHYLVIVDGEATVTIDRVAVASLGPGSAFCEVAVVTGGGCRAATVTAATSMTLLVLPMAEFRVLVEEAPFVARRLQRETARRLSPATSGGTRAAQQLRRSGLRDTQKNRKKETDP